MFLRRSYKRCASLILIILGGTFLLTGKSIAQPTTLDTTYKKALIRADTTKPVIDSAKYYIIDRSHGSLFQLPYSAYSTIRKEDLSFRRYHEFSDLVAEQTTAYPLWLGSYGQFNSFSFFGGNPKDIAVTFNNRPLNDLEYGSFNLENIAPESFEKAEIITGSDAVILSGNSSGALINIQEIRYNSKVPYTKLFFGQAGNEFLTADGIFSQNFAPNWNFNFGFRTMSGLGRYTNNKLDGWNIRLGFQWNPADRTTISLSEIFTNHGIGTNGGLQTQNFDELTTEVVYTSLKERIFRHDLTLSFSSLLGADSTTAISSNIFFTYSDKEKIISEDIIPITTDSNTKITWLTRFFGANLRYEQKLLNFFTFRAGGEYMQPNLEKSVYNSAVEKSYISAFAHGQINLTKSTLLTGGLRIRKAEDNYSMSLGAKANITLFENVNFLADLSKFERTPSAVEARSNVEKENGFLGIFRLEYLNKRSKISLESFFRNTEKPILIEPIRNDAGYIIQTKAYNGNNRKVLGASLTVSSFFFDHLFISGFASTWQSQTDGTNDTRFPQLYLGIDSYYEITAGKSILRIGLDAKGVYQSKGEFFIPLTREYMAYNGDSRSMFNGLEGYVSARLGNAFIKAMYRNVLSQPFYYVPLYPIYDRNFCLIVTISFMD
jgi:hypothetical protein